MPGPSAVKLQHGCIDSIPREANIYFTKGGQIILSHENNARSDAIELSVISFY